MRQCANQKKICRFHIFMHHCTNQKSNSQIKLLWCGTASIVFSTSFSYVHSYTSSFPNYFFDINFLNYMVF